jgi:YidC/Oxa1 family membrane protein insertase
MTDMRRTLLWVVFTMSLVLLWDRWTVHTGQPSMFGGSPRPAATQPGGPSATLPTAPAVPVAGVPTPSAAVVPAGAAPAASAPAAALPATTTAAPASEKITLTTDVVKASFDAAGGTLVRLELLNYKDAQLRRWYEPFVDLFRSSGTRPEVPNVVLFEQDAKRVYLAQTGLITAQPGVTLPNHLTQMTPVVSERTLKEGSNELQIRFESPAVDGLRLVKTYTLKRGEYTIGVKHEFINDSGKPVTPQLYLQLARDGNPPEGESSFYFTFTGPALYTDAGKFKKIDFKDIEKGKVDMPPGADNGWVSMVQHYFASAWLLAGNEPREFRVQRVSDNLYAIATVVPLGEVAPGSSKVLQSTLFAGPQEENKLAALAPGLDLVKDYGWFTILAKPLFWLLDQLHKVLGNWGWSIVALMVLLKIAFYWLNASAYRSMAKMKAVAPKVTELRERYKDKPQQMQQEMMRIYREEKVNPLGGCLPIVAQMPFFIALYWVLLSSVEMRGAPWILWIHDLSQPDPYFILPLLMTASTMFQTWLNPRPPDPMQAKLMWYMPLAFSVMFFFFPAGLVLYWLTNNILSIAQQWYINKKLGVLGK